MDEATAALHIKTTEPISTESRLLEFTMKGIDLIKKDQFKEASDWFEPENTNKQITEIKFSKERKTVPVTALDLIRADMGPSQQDTFDHGWARELGAQKDGTIILPIIRFLDSPEQYNPELLKHFFRDLSLAKCEEFCHCMQTLRAPQSPWGSSISKYFSNASSPEGLLRDRQEREVDITLFFIEQGIDLNNTNHLTQYKRKKFLSGNNLMPIQK